jgi:hypothetical protein
MFRVRDIKMHFLIQEAKGGLAVGLTIPPLLLTTADEVIE